MILPYSSYEKHIPPRLKTLWDENIEGELDAGRWALVTKEMDIHW